MVTGATTRDHRCPVVSADDRSPPLLELRARWRGEGDPEPCAFHHERGIFGPCRSSTRKTIVTDDLLERACERFRDGEIAQAKQAGRHDPRDCPCQDGHDWSMAHGCHTGCGTEGCTRCDAMRTSNDRAFGTFRGRCQECLSLPRWPELPEHERKRIRKLLRPVVGTREKREVPMRVFFFAALLLCHCGEVRLRHTIDHPQDAGSPWDASSLLDSSADAQAGDSGGPVDDAGTDANGSDASDVDAAQDASVESDSGPCDGGAVNACNGCKPIDDWLGGVCPNAQGPGGIICDRGTWQCQDGDMACICERADCLC